MPVLRIHFALCGNRRWDVLCGRVYGSRICEMRYMRTGQIMSVWMGYVMGSL